MSPEADPDSLGNAEAAAPAPADAEAAARMARARAEVQFGPRIGMPRRRWSRFSCTLVVVVLVAVALGGLFLWGWLEEPERVVYGASLTQDTAQQALWLGRGFYMQLPGDWEAVSPTRFTGPGGTEVSVQYGVLTFFRMSPRTYSGQPLRGRYTATAYGRGLLERFKGSTLGGTRYVSIQTYRGVEGWLRLANGEMLRALAVVFKNRRDVLELRFRLKGDQQSPAWQQADQILNTLTGGLPPPAPPPDEPEKAAPNAAPGPVQSKPGTDDAKGEAKGDAK